MTLIILPRIESLHQTRGDSPSAMSTMWRPTALPAALRRSRGRSAHRTYRPSGRSPRQGSPAEFGPARPRTAKLPLPPLHQSLGPGARTRFGGRSPRDEADSPHDRAQFLKSDRFAAIQGHASGFSAPECSVRAPALRLGCALGAVVIAEVAEPGGAGARAPMLGSAQSHDGDGCLPAAPLRRVHQVVRTRAAHNANSLRSASVSEPPHRIVTSRRSGTSGRITTAPGAHAR